MASDTSARLDVASGLAIAAVEVFKLKLPYRAAVSFKTVRQSVGEYVILRLVLDNGLEGIAEAICRPEQSGEDATLAGASARNLFQAAPARRRSARPSCAAGGARSHPRLPFREVADRHRALGFARQGIRPAGLAAARRHHPRADPAHLDRARQYARGASCRGQARGRGARLQGLEDENLAPFARRRRHGRRDARRGRARADDLYRLQRLLHRERGAHHPAGGARAQRLLHRGAGEIRRSVPRRGAGGGTADRGARRPVLSGARRRQQRCCA